MVAMSTAEAEYVARAEAAMEAVGLRNILIESIRDVTVKVKLYIDNQAALVRPSLQHTDKAFRIEVAYIRDLIKREKLAVRKIEFGNNPAYILTTALLSGRLQYP